MKTKAFNSLLALLCALALFLTGCGEGETSGTQGSTQAPSGPMGAFVETLMESDGYDAITTPTIAADGGIWAAARRSSDQTWALLNWADIKAKPAVAPLSIEGTVSQLSMSPSGDIALLVSKPIELPGLAEAEVSGGNAPATSTQTQPNRQNTNPNQNRGGNSGQGMVMSFSSDVVIYWVDKQGNIVSEREMTVENDMVSSIAALDGNELLVSTTRGGITRYDAKGEVAKVYDGLTASSFVVSGGKIYATVGGAGMGGGGGGSSIYVVDIESGEVVSTTLGVRMQNAVMAVSADGTVYYVSSDGIQKLAEGATDPELVMDGVNYSLGDPTYNLQGAAITSDGVVLVSIGNSVMGGISFSSGGGGGMAVSSVMGAPNGGSGGNAELLAYTWSPDIDLSQMKTLRITGLYDSQLVRKAISEFQREHPDVRIELNTYADNYSDDTPVTDYIRSINSALLAGDGGDVLLLDGLPIETYAKKGVLADLTDVLSSVGILPGILRGSVADDGKIYAVPATFSLSTLWGSASTLNGVSTLADLAALKDTIASEKTVLPSRTAEQLLRLFFPSSLNQFVDSSGNYKFDTAEFEQFLEYMYALYSEPDANTANNNPFGGSGVVMATRAGGRGGFDMNDLMQMANQNAEIMSYSFSSFGQLSMVYSVAGAENSAWMGIPDFSGDSLSYTPSILAGVNAKAKYPELAAEFVRLLYSGAVQELAGMNGLPTVTTALDELLEETIKNNDSMFTRFVGGGGFSFDMVNADEATLRALRAYCDLVENPITVDETLISFLVEETAKFFEGSKSAADTANAVHQRVAAYLAE